MKKINRLIIVLILFCLAVALLCACGPDDPVVDPPFVEQDYVPQLTLDMNSSTKKAIVTVKTYIDGDTTHFNINDDFFADGVLKARYLAINTPESTGQIEPWGKTASDFTKSVLKNAASILVESNDDKWNPDSTGSRYLVFVWYKTTNDGPWRNLNLEILQNGLARASNTAGNRYGETCISALNQAKHLKLKVHSDEPDPDFYYGSAQYISMKELRCNITEYNLQKVAFDGIVTRSSDGGFYVENYDVESGLYFGMYVYLGNGAPAEVLSAIKIGNYVRVSGTVTEFQNTYQVSGVTSDSGDSVTTEVLNSEDELAGFERKKNGSKWYYYASYTLTSADTFANGKRELEFVTIDNDVETITKREFDYCELVLGTTLTMENLHVDRTYTTSTGTSKGAFTLYCSNGGVNVTIRTEVLRDDSGNLVTADAYEGKTITVKGVANFFKLDDQSQGSYQIQILNVRDITILD